MKRIAWTLPKDEVDKEALRQIDNVLALPSFRRMAVLPDVHTGYDLPIGCAVILDGHISPSFVGYDIGCGMIHLNLGQDLGQDLGPNLGTGAPALTSRDSLTALYRDILARVPVGLGEGFTKPRDYPYFESASGDKGLDKKVNASAAVQIGTLGAGNHFIEIGRNAKGEYGVTIHSGSRNAGHAIASHYMARGRVFSLSSALGRAYAEDMDWALNYALENRKRMLLAVLSALSPSREDAARPLTFINENHNHAEVLKGGRVLHRKGATPAEKDQMGIIPINQRDGVYITRGLGNEEYLCSASHGAGRRLSRKAAKKEISPARLAEQMEGIVCRTDKQVCDEGPDAYKNADLVIARQAGLLVDIVDHFRPILVVKG